MHQGASWQLRPREGGVAALGELTPILVGQALSQRWSMMEVKRRMSLRLVVINLYTEYMNKELSIILVTLTGWKETPE